ncbi:ribosome small subunit-dependent GTPase A [Alkaliphilus metalliredigens QYMF]|uniref:Small ribosomal subunit biogenesis GTPase RsgA n=1 Tax=Alkaliphilus metalliredigens (strain QYMF) TaxID=293826 RepID=RSGA_ALKMQ|nr:ribosome small subunit-dependent GTPase A [Alkaliphilus metalliredigens]A6TRW0.1 RecName: Full=Small ribosomal subunit biogenesis GTPase RsgA [Alkaliphilus metalliredigens QYMF]ABR48928.1 ribosome small subunit-dependent GTPase A [Alkaliphilus metalliredigens QYMF]
MSKGKLIKGIAGFYYVEVNKEVYECKGRGILRKKKLTPLVGDYVEITVTDEDNKKGMIDDIFPRKTELIRPTVANVDQVIVVFSVTQPDPHLSLLDHFLILAETQNIDVVICLNKLDLVQREDVAELVGIYEKVGYPVILTSQNDSIGLEQLEKVLRGKTTVFAGPSGVGKSTLLNRILPHVTLQTGELSSKIARGKHTTRHVELISLETEGWVVDTPGFSSLNIDFLKEEELADYFIDFEPFAKDCRFLSCVHLNEPICGVKTALKAGQLVQSRYNSYLQMIGEIKKNRRY